MAGSDWAGSWNAPTQDGIAIGGKKKSPAKAKPRGLATLTIPELRANAKSKGIKIPSIISKKAEIVAFLRSKN